MTLQKYQKGLHTVYRLEAEDEGVKILIFGAIHGNEPCGTKGIEQFLENLENPIKNGLVTFIPICNPKAYEGKRRLCNSDLNRGFGVTPPEHHYEQELVSSLKEHIDEHDILLDIHSYQRKTIPFILNDKDLAINNDWVKSLHPEIVITGWGDIYPDGGDTNAYAHEMGKHSLTVECGQHDDTNAPNVAERLIAETLNHFGVIDTPVKNHADKQEYKIKELVKKPSDNAVFTQEWQNFAAIQPDIPIYQDGDDAFCYNEENSLIFMPKPFAKDGQEWFYIIEKLTQ